MKYVLNTVVMRMNRAVSKRGGASIFCVSQRGRIGACYP